MLTKWGIAEKKLNDIREKLLRLMPPSRANFWNSLNVANVADLQNSRDNAEEADYISANCFLMCFLYCASKYFYDNALCLYKT